MKDFVHLHVHSEYSLLDGACKISDLIKKTKELNQKAVAITDHGVMFGVINFYKEAKKNGIKPIIGCEVYVAEKSRFDKNYRTDSKSNHLVLLCKNFTGYKNLMKITSKGFLEGFYKKPRVDDKILSEYSEGLIAFSACLAGKIPRLILKDDIKKAYENALFYQNLFGKDNFYLELQDHNIPEQKKVNEELIKISKKTNIPLIATNDCHYILKEDSKSHQVLLCIQTASSINDEKKFEFKTDEFYFKNSEEMIELFKKTSEAVTNTVKVANMCNLEIDFSKTRLPKFYTPNGEDNFSFFKEKCHEGFLKKYGKDAFEDEKNVFKSRLEYEIKIIKKMGYVDYFLIVRDFVAFAKYKNIPVGPGRGSVCGSIVAFCMDITEIDPIKFDLIFERFLNPERISMPDVDIDFCFIRRGEVIDYVINKYGKNHVAQIITFGTMAARLAVRDVGRVLGFSYSEVDKIAKLIPMELGITIKEAIENSEELKNIYKTKEKIKELIDIAIKLEGMPRHASQHAAGVVITKKETDKYVPLTKLDNCLVTQYPMNVLESLGLLKMDFLGLKTLTVIDDCQKMIKKNEPKFNIKEINLKEKDVYDFLAKGFTEGIFQLESRGMTSILTKINPTSLEDLIAAISLHRPGPMSFISTYIENKHNKNKIVYKHKSLENILKLTNGCIIYQEQVMQIFRNLAGYSLERADIVRRAISKKKVDILEKEKNAFIKGCKKNNIDEKIAKEIFVEIGGFASYAFNKSHAAAYALLAYRSAFLKCKYKEIYMASLMTHALGNIDKISKHMAECKRLKIKVLPPDVNESEIGFKNLKDGIRFGLLAIKNLGPNLIDLIVKERKLGKFLSFYDFCKRMYQNIDHVFNKKALESLIKSGALNCFETNRHQMLIISQRVLDFLESSKKQKIEGQIGFFDKNNPAQDFVKDVKSIKEFDFKTLINMEKEATGLYLSGNPLDFYDKKDFTPLSKIFLKKQDEFAKVLGIISKIQIKKTKSGQSMAFIKLEDMEDTAEMIIFPKLFSEFSIFLKEGEILRTLCKVKSNEEKNTLICQEIITTNNKENIWEKYAKEKNTEEKSLYLKISSQKSKKYKKVTNLLGIFTGSIPVYIYFEDTKKLMITPKNLFVSINEVMLEELKNILGGENVVEKSQK